MAMGTTFITCSKEEVIEDRNVLQTSNVHEASTERIDDGNEAVLRKNLTKASLVVDITPT